MNGSIVSGWMAKDDDAQYKAANTIEQLEQKTPSV